MTDKFLGCILSIKTKPLPNIQNIIGTVRAISINPSSQALILDDAMANGKVLNDGFVVLSSTIADLQVLGKASEFFNSTKKNLNFVKNDLNYSPTVGVEKGEQISSDSSSNDSADSADNEEEEEGEEEDRPVLPSHHKMVKPKPRRPAVENFRSANFDEDILSKTFGTVTGQKLGALSCFMAAKTAEQPQKPLKNPSNCETFNDLEIQDEEFDFEQNNAMFCKLPVTFPPQKPTSLTKNPARDPKFTSHDTTHKMERVVPSTLVKNSPKSFLTDTGIAIPAVDLPTRSRILNLANDVGLGHERMIETMARAVVSVALPLLGSACRLSPERADNLRPWVLVLAGPHWQGAVGIASARILTTLGVHTFVHAPKEDLGVCAKEEKLYSLTGEGISRRLEDLPSHPYDLIIHSLNDHLSPTLTVSPYLKHLQNSQLIYVDPPLVEKYRVVESKVFVLSPLLPLNYEVEPGVKFFCVNLGVPLGVYLREGVGYKSFFGDKVVVGVFGMRK